MGRRGGEGVGRRGGEGVGRRGGERTNVLRTVLHIQSDHVSLPDAQISKMVSNSIRILFQITVGPLASIVNKNNCRFIRVLGRHFSENIDEIPFFVEVELETCDNFYQK